MRLNLREKHYFCVDRFTLQNVYKFKVLSLIIRLNEWHTVMVNAITHGGYNSVVFLLLVSFLITDLFKSSCSETSPEFTLCSHKACGHQGKKLVIILTPYVNHLSWRL